MSSNVIEPSYMAITTDVNSKGQVDIGVIVCNAYNFKSAKDHIREISKFTKNADSLQPHQAFFS